MNTDTQIIDTAGADRQRAIAETDPKNLLTISNADGAVLVQVQIAEINPATATVAILGALNAIPKPRRQRSDKGKTKEAAK